MFLYKIIQGFSFYAISIISTHLFNFVYSRLKNTFIHKKIKGKWILITGATDGIGKSLAIEFARLKYKVIILGRNEDKLLDVESQMIKRGGVVTRKVYDFNKTCDFSELHEYDIGLLINNAGVSYNHPNFFIKDNMEEIINVNILNTLKITRVILNKMMTNKMGYVVNIGSITGDFPMPLLSSYAASKSMIKAWSEALYFECKKYKVNVECMDTGFVATKMSNIKRTSFFCPSSDIYAKSIVRHFGSGCLSFAYLPHLILYCIMSLVPRNILGLGTLLHMNKTREYFAKKQKIR